MNRSSNLKSRFTLIELLVVIAIIAILASILMPALSAARERSRAATCVNNMKTVMAAVARYSEDYDGYIYAAYKDHSVFTDFTYDPDAKNVCNWSTMLVRKKYISGGNKVNSPLFCPSSTTTIPDTAADKILKYSYAASSATAYPSGSTNYYAHNTRLRHIPGRASEIVFAADAADPATNTPAHILHHSYNASKVDHGYLFYVHNGRANVAFVDGHCASVQPYVSHHLLRVTSGGAHYRIAAGLEGTPGATTVITWTARITELKP